MRFSVLLIVALLLAYLMSIDTRGQAKRKRSTMKKGRHAIMIMPRDACEDHLEYCTSEFCIEQSYIQNGNATCQNACYDWYQNCQ
uniref:Venom peptide Pna9.12 n=1 Tax=Purpuraturris nadaensis TaxID=3243997 RepID=A0A976QNE4_9CAEN|nr:venom peptide precursor Pna9.12 [Turris nadaensis]